MPLMQGQNRNMAGTQSSCPSTTPTDKQRTEVYNQPSPLKSL